MADILSSVSVALGADISGFQREFAVARRELAGFVKAGQAMKEIGSNLTQFVSAPLAAAGLGAVKLAGDFEKASVNFEVMLGSAKEAGKVLQDLKGFADSTPFEFPEVQQAAKKLLAFNTPASELKSTLRSLGDIAAGVDAPIGEIAEIYGKARVQGRLFQEDINQLTGRGIPIIQELAKQFGVADGEVRKLVETGKVGFPNIEKAFQSLTAEGGKFSGLMEKQSQTIPGLVSSALDAAKGFATDIGLEITKSFNVKGALKDFIAFASDLRKSFAELDPQVKKIALGVAAFAVATGPVLVAVGTLTSALVPLKAAFVTLTGPVGLAVVAVGAAAFLIIQHWDEIVAYFTTGEGGRVFSELATSVKASVTAIQGALGKLSGIGGDTFGDLISASGIVKAVFEDLAKGITAVADTVTAAVNTITALFELDFAKAFQEAGKYVEAFTRQFRGIFTKSPEAPKETISSFFKIADTFKAVDEAAGNAALSGGNLANALDKVAVSGKKALTEDQVKVLKSLSDGLKQNAEMSRALGEDRGLEIVANDYDFVGGKMKALESALPELIRAFGSQAKVVRQTRDELKLLKAAYSDLEKIEIPKLPAGFGEFKTKAEIIASVKINPLDNSSIQQVEQQLARLGFKVPPLELLDFKASADKLRTLAERLTKLPDAGGLDVTRPIRDARQLTSVLENLTDIRLGTLAPVGSLDISQPLASVARLNAALADVEGVELPAITGLDAGQPIANVRQLYAAVSQLTGLSLAELPDLKGIDISQPITSIETLKKALASSFGTPVAMAGLDTSSFEQSADRVQTSATTLKASLGGLSFIAPIVSALDDQNFQQSVSRVRSVGLGLAASLAMLVLPAPLIPAVEAQNFTSSIESIRNSSRELTTELGKSLVDMAPVVPGIDTSAYQNSALQLRTLRNGVVENLTSKFTVTPIPGPDTQAVKKSALEVKIAMDTIKAQLKGAVLPTLKLPGIEAGKVPDELISPEFAQRAAAEAKALAEEYNAAVASMTPAQIDAVARQADFNTQMAALVEQLNSSVGPLVADFAGQFGDAFGSIIAGTASASSAFQTLFSGILGSIAQFMGDFGKQLIAIGIGKLSLDSLFNGPQGGPLAIAAGLGLVALAGVAKAVSKSASASLAGIGSGGGGSMPSMKPPSPSSYQSPAARSTAPPPAAAAPVTVIHQVQMIQRGSDLIGVIQVQNDRNGRVVGRPLGR